MKKSSIALSVIVCISSMGLQAETEFYGKARVSLTNSDDGGTDGDATTIDSNTSRLGFRGDHNMDNGMSFFWQIENEVKFDTGSQSNGSSDNDDTDDDTENFGFKARNTYAGVKGNFGSVLLGKHDTPYKKSSSKLDIWSDSWGDYNSLIGNNPNGNSHNIRASNTVFYTSPDMSGAKIMLGYLADETRDATDDDGYSIAGTYQSGPLYVAVATESLNEQGAGGDDDTATKVSGSWDFGQGTSVAAIWESMDGGGSNNDRDGYYLHAKHKMGKNTLKASYSVADEVGGANDTGANSIIVGASRALSASTEVYALYGRTSNDAAASYGLDPLDVGLIGEDVTALSFGINHNFSSK